MSTTDSGGRPNQRRRTRKDLLQAAARLMKAGKKPSLEEIAEEAMVSRATAYRYFPSVEALHVEAALDVVAPEAEVLFAGDAGTDAVGRLEKVDAAFEKMCRENEAALRMMLAYSMERSVKGEKGGEAGDGDVPKRQNRRMPLIEAALAPVRKEFRAGDLEMLKKGLALVVGTESMIVFKDVLQVGDEEARRVRGWVIRALVAAARR